MNPVMNPGPMAIGIRKRARKTLKAASLAVAFSALMSPQLTEAQSINVVVEATWDGYAVPLSASRDAHFNWSFQSSGGGAVQMGQFACGSYWVAPANGDTGVTLLSLTGNPSWNDLLSCDADPVTHSHGLLDGSNNYGNYNASENVLSNLPMTFTPSSGSCISLVAAMQRNEAETSGGGTKAIVGEVVDAYCVVTVMASAPANGGSDMIRPNITGTTKEFLTWADFDLSRLPTYSFMSGKDTQGWQDAVSRWRHSIEIFGFRTEISPGTWKQFSEGGRAFRSHILIHDYASGAAKLFNDDFLAMFSDSNTLAEKKPALAAMLSYGLDIYHCRYDIGTGPDKSWNSGAGQWGGQFLAPVLVGALQIDETKAHQLRQVAIYSHGSDPDNLGPQELRQLNRGVTGVLLWGDRMPVFRDGNTMSDADWRYWSDFRNSYCYDTASGTCNPNIGKKTSADLYGYIDGPANQPGTLYMAVSFGGVRGLAAAMVLSPAIRSVVNTDDPIEYVDRLVRHGIWTYPDPVAPIAAVDQSGCNTWYNTNGCLEWGITWGPVPSDIRFAIEDGVGRFHSMHGDPADFGSYDPSLAKNNWSSIIALYDGPTYEDNAVAVGVVTNPEIIFETGSSPKAHILIGTIDAEIRYTLDGTDPTSSSTLYTGPISVTVGTEVRARGYYPNFVDSAIRSKVLVVGDSNAPTTPTNLAYGNLGVSSVDLSWTASTDDTAVAGYKVYIDGANPIGGIFGTSVQLDGLQPSTSYTFTVSAYDSSGNESSQSTSVSVTTLTDVTPPSVPTGLANSGVTSSSVTLVWNASTDDSGVVAYKIYTNGVNPIQVTDTFYTVPNLASGTTYTFTVSALDGVPNESAQSVGHTVTTPVTSLPAAPSNLSASVSSSSEIVLNWMDNSGNETGFAIERKTGGGSFAEITTVAANAESYSDSNLSAGATYTYRVLAYNATGDSAYSNQATATTSAVGPLILSVDLIDSSTDQVISAFTDGMTINFAQVGSLLSAEAYGSLQTESVRFWLDGSIFRTESAPPYALNGDDASGDFYDWTPGLGSHTLAVIPYSADGAGGTAGPTVTINFTVIDQAGSTPGAPSGLSATAVSSSRIDLSWTDNSSDENGFAIERKSGGGSFVEIMTVGADTQSYSDTALSASTTYTYRVLAYNSSGDSEYSNEASDTTQSPPPPSAPSGLSASVASSSQIDLSWTDNSGDETGFSIERKSGAGSFAQISTVGAGVTSYADSSLSAGTSYTYRVRAYNAYGNSGYTNEATATTSTSGPLILSVNLINSNTDQVISAFTDGMTINLAEVGSLLNAEAVGSAQTESVRFWLDGSVFRTESAPPYALNGDDASGDFYDWTPGLGSHTLAVIPYSADGAGGTAGPTVTINFTVINQAASVPSAPSGLSAGAVSTSQIDLSWTDNSSDETGFAIERKTGGGSFAQIATVGAGVTSYADSGLSASTTYTYRVLAYNGAGDSAYSNEAADTTQSPPPPTAPSGLSASATSTSQIDLSWTDNASDETGFSIERKTGGGSFAQITTVGANVTSYADSSLSAGTGYTYRVRAYNAYGNSSYSNEAGDTTQSPPPPSAPSALSASVVSSSQIDLSWTDNSSDETGFSIERKPSGGSFSEVAMVSADAESYSDPGLSAGTSYTYRVRAYNAYGNSGYTSEVTATTSASGPLILSVDLINSDTDQVISAFTNGMTINLAEVGSLLSVDAVGSAQTESVRFWLDSSVFRTESAPPYALNGDDASGDFFDWTPSLGSHTLEMIPYSADGAGGTAGPTVTINFTVINQASVPGAPSGLSATAASASQIDLGWTDNSSDETGFAIERKTGGGSFAEIATVGAGVTSYADATVSASTTYTYRVLAYNSSGDSGYSNEAMETTPASSGGTSYYVDPASGSMANPGTSAQPWSTLEAVFTAGKTFSSGDVIYLRTGLHGFPVISGSPSGTVTIQPETGHSPTLRQVTFDDADYFTLVGVEISPELDGGDYIPGSFIVSINDTCSNIVVSNCLIYSAASIVGWDQNDWASNAGRGVICDAPNSIVTGNTIQNVEYGIFMSFSAVNSTASYNAIENFSIDGIWVLADGQTVEYNLITDGYAVNGNHRDGIQSFTYGAGGVGTSTLYDVVIRGNVVINCTDASRPFKDYVQGIGCFDGFFEDWIVENNLICTDAYHGISLLGATDCRIVNNTVVKNPLEVVPEVPWIAIWDHKDGSYSTGNVVRNNLTSALNNDPGIGAVDNNIVTSSYTSHFVDYANFDLHLKSSSSAIDAGSTTLAPAIDYEEQARDANPDIGADEF